MTKKTITFALVGLMLFGLLFAQGTTPQKKTTVPADPNADPKLVDRPIPIGVPEHAIDALNLSQAQKDAFGTLRTDHQKQMIDFRAAIEKIELDIKEAIKNENFAEAKRLNTSLYNKKKEMADARIDHIQAIYKELNAEQKTMMKANGGHFGFFGRGGHGMKRSPGHFRSRKDSEHHWGEARGMRQRMRNPEDCWDPDGEKPETPTKPRPSTPDTPMHK
ncbi:MAG: hypothetical protein GX122_00555 [Candidatus Cloacimonetes bacterium]|nr:hypothetical protein [Candidatus Cloacimonadota bacterium]